MPDRALYRLADCLFRVLDRVVDNQEVRTAARHGAAYAGREHTAPEALQLPLVRRGNVVRDLEPDEAGTPLDNAF